MVHRLVLWLALLAPVAAAPLIVPAPAVAQTAVQLTADERAGLEARAAETTRLVDAGQFGAMTDLIPPPLLSTLAGQYGVDEAEARVAIRAGFQRMMSSITILEYVFHVDGARAFVTPDGSRRYALVDLTTLMEAEGTRMRALTPNLAFVDDGVWYIMDVSEPAQAAVLRQAYPEFEGVTFERGTMEFVD
ncbi:hypothetical protein [Brevundimonas sp.]|uniref:hypothetical protein n=1 Tax=Brevundimonas sp. TaxID=1871086 RepID=UPI003AF466A0